MTWKLQSSVMGVPDISLADPFIPGPANLPGAVFEPQLGEIRLGSDINLGSGEFIFLKGAASLTAGGGDVVSYNALTGVTTRWAGTANSGAPLAVAVGNPPATQYGWFQISGNAIVNCTGTVAAGDIVNFSATASVKSAAAAGKQVLNAVAATANGATLGAGNSAVTLASTQAVYSINRPFAQGAIT